MHSKKFMLDECVVTIASSPRFASHTNSLNKCAIEQKLLRPLPLKMKAAIEEMTKVLTTASGRKIIKSLNASSMESNPQKVITTLFLQLQTELKNKHFSLIEANMQAYSGSTILDPLCFKDKDLQFLENQLNDQNEENDISKYLQHTALIRASDSELRNHGLGYAFVDTPKSKNQVTTPFQICLLNDETKDSCGTYEVKDKVVDRSLLFSLSHQSTSPKSTVSQSTIPIDKNLAKHLKDHLEKCELPFNAGTILKDETIKEKPFVHMGESTQKVLHGGYCVESLGDSGAETALKMVLPHNQHKTLEFKIESKEDTSYPSHNCSSQKHDLISLSDLSPIIKNARSNTYSLSQVAKEKVAIDWSLDNQALDTSDSCSSQDKTPSSAHVLRNRSIMIGSQIKAKLRQKKQKNSAALGRNVTPFPSSEMSFRKRLLLEKNPGISHWVRRLFQLNNNYLNVYAKCKRPFHGSPFEQISNDSSSNTSSNPGNKIMRRHKYIGSYSLTAFTDVAVRGQRIVCTFGRSSPKMHLILHARSVDDAIWWGRRMILHQTFFATSLFLPVQHIQKILSTFKDETNGRNSVH